VNELDCGADLSGQGCFANSQGAVELQEDNFGP